MKKEKNTNTSSFDTFIRCKFKKASLFKSSRPEVFCRKSVLRNLAKFTGKYLYQSFFFNKVAGLVKFTGKYLCQRFFFFLRPATLLKKDRHFPVKFMKFLRTLFLIEDLLCLLLFIDAAIPLHNFEFQKKKCSMFHC